MPTLGELCNFAEAVASAGIPRVRVIVHDPSLTPKMLEIVTDVGDHLPVSGGRATQSASKVPWLWALG